MECCFSRIGVLSSIGYLKKRSTDHFKIFASLDKKDHIHTSLGMTPSLDQVITSCLAEKGQVTK